MTEKAKNESARDARLDTSNYPVCIHPGEFPKCCYYFSGKCGGRGQQSEAEWKCVEDLDRERRKGYPDCIYPGKYPGCSFYFDGKCGARPEYPPDYSYPKMTWKCAQDILKEKKDAEPERDRRKTRPGIF